MKKYKVIYADPPWAYKVWSKKGAGRSAESHYRHLPQIRAVPPCGELRHLSVNEPFFLLRHIELHLNVPLSVCHGQPPFLIRVWDIPASNFDCSGKGPEQRKIRKRGLACCAC